MITALPFEWFILLLRLVFVFLLYFFLLLVIRVTLRELAAVASAQRGGSSSIGHLIVQSPGMSSLRPGTRLPLEPVSVIGRHPQCTIRLDDSFVSTEHAQLTWDKGRWWISDLGSTNGTRVNGQPVTAPTGLRYGDVIELGDVRLVLSP
ncbi:FHA domain-containing protein [Thermomicrobiaceae bacterium CFH 74404]|uniref:FHA domain-containing protein n=3 Tax=Thermomicrobia TaxID=189775 RepID=A0AA41W9I5_9BACT|nr:FHA domain-containing protein [Thermalbibacter longus]MCM8748234.1 FHA domain-containing protein [Thermalbibacter longus]